MLVYACVAPHGGELVPVLAGTSLRLFSPKRRGIRILARRMKEADPDTIIVASPHSLRLMKHIGVVISENSSGRVAAGRKEVRVSAKCGVELGKKVIKATGKRSLPVVGANYGALEGPFSDLAMDWGTLIPLWFFLKENGLKSRILIVTTSRGIPLSQNFEFGRAIAEVVENSRERVTFVASSDQAHTHRRDGPYGFSKRAKEHDQAVLDAIRNDRLSTIMAIGFELVKAAKPDGLWQMTILAGVLSVVPMKAELVSYQVPSYYGMSCAGYVPRS